MVKRWPRTRRGESLRAPDDLIKDSEKILEHQADLPEHQSMLDAEEAEEVGPRSDKHVHRSCNAGPVRGSADPS